MTEKKDILITLLEFGKERIHSPLELTEIQERLKKYGYITKENENDIKIFLSQLINDNFDHRTIDSKKFYFIKTSSYFSLLEYIELKESRISSNQARCLAWLAIVISILTFGYSAYISNQPIKIDSSQFKLIQEKIINVN